MTLHVSCWIDKFDTPHLFICITESLGVFFCSDPDMVNLQTMLLMPERNSVLMGGHQSTMHEYDIETRKQTNVVSV